VELQLKGKHQLLVYANDINLLGDNIDTIKKNTEILIDASKEVGQERDVDTIKYVVTCIARNRRDKHHA
jgi:hypothetical protein